MFEIKWSHYIKILLSDNKIKLLSKPMITKGGKEEMLEKS